MLLTVPKYLSDVVDAEVHALEAGHAQEGAWVDLTDAVAAEVQVLQGGQHLHVALTDCL